MSGDTFEDVQQQTVLNLSPGASFEIVRYYSDGIAVEITAEDGNRRNQFIVGYENEQEGTWQSYALLPCPS